MALELRPIVALEEGPRRLARNPIPPPPKIAWLALDQLVIDPEYQRGLSEASRRLIRRLVERWDWNRFKPLSVASCGGGVYEVIDGQHTAIAASTHGAIETLPCLVLDAATRAERSAAFVGINSDRIALTPFALYRARLAAGELEAVAVSEALSASGAQLLESLRYDVDYPAGSLACVSSLLQIVRRGGAPRLSRLLKIAIAAEITPVPSGILKGLEEALSYPDGPTDRQLTSALLELGGDTVIDMAGERRRTGTASSVNQGVMQVLLTACERKAA